MNNIAELLHGNATIGLIVGILIVKSLMWAFSLGSGTSGGVLAPLLMIGGAVGAMAGHLAHASVEAQAFWALIGMGSMLAGSLGVPLTAILFSLEVTHCLPALLPLTMACIASYLVTALLMPRSILTEKLSRRGYHLTREYGVDPLELVIIRDLMSPITSFTSEGAAFPPFMPTQMEPRGGAAEIMASEGLTTLPVVERRSQQICGTISLSDLLRGRSRSVGARERTTASVQLCSAGAGWPTDRQNYSVFFLFRALILNQIGLPINPKFSRIWFPNNRSNEKCILMSLSVNSTNVGGATAACVM